MLAYHECGLVGFCWLVLAHGHIATKRLGPGSLNVPFVRAFEKPPPFPSASGQETLAVSIMASPIPNRGPELYTVDISFLVAAVIAYGLRCYVRTRMIKSFGRDDYLMAAATVSSAPQTIN